MALVKERMKEVIDAQPADATYDEIVRALVIDKMIERGLADSRDGRTLDNEEMAARIRSWQR
ncbi:MAG: hypothetical protein CSA21_07670 [Deltaproteobacteria bacterium]|nr:MAG: hypothetical protein CSA21_07670 [Deltaproteobacteria bacterium]